VRRGGGLVSSFFLINYALEDGERAEVDRFDAVESEIADSERTEAGIGGIGGVVDDADV